MNNKVAKQQSGVGQEVLEKDKQQGNKDVMARH
jgi:hypothetical protein